LESRYRIQKKGTYRFSIRQNMRDEQLLQVSDVGLRIEKGEKPY
jgi:gliding motility-associated lipoprotein GldH